VIKRFFWFLVFKILQNKTDSSFLDLGKSREKEESVGRDHIGSSLGVYDTKLEADNQWFGVGPEAGRPSD
jgi:hypothetical protein